MAEPEAGGEGPDKQGDNEEPTATEDRYPSFLFLLKSFWDALDAIRDLHDEMAPHAEALDRRRQSGADLAAIAELPPDKQRRLAEWVDSKFPDEGEGGPDDTNAEGESETEVDEEDLAFFDEVFGGPDTEAFAKFRLNLQWVAMSYPRHLLLNASLLTAAVGALEVLIGGVKARDLALNPDQFGEAQEFSLADLRRFESVSDAEDEAIADRVDSFVRLGLMGWIDWLAGRTSLNPSSYALDLEALEEVLQRRHVIVHNAGRASRSYLSKVSQRFSKDVAIETHLPVDADYIQAALDELDAFGTLFAVGAWSKWEAEPVGMPMFALQDRSYDAMVADRWAVSAKLTDVAKKVRGDDVTEEQHLIFLCNHWLSRKRVRGVEDIREEVVAWDASALGHNFVLVRACLLGDIDEAVRVADVAIRADVLKAHMLRTWPALQELREDSRFPEILKTAEDREEA